MLAMKFKSRSNSFSEAHLPRAPARRWSGPFGPVRYTPSNPIGKLRGSPRYFTSTRPSSLRGNVRVKLSSRDGLMGNSKRFPEIVDAIAGSALAGAVEGARDA